MVALRHYQEEMKSLIFFHESEKTSSTLWKGTIPERLRVYRNNTRSNWGDTLDADFRLTRKQFDASDWLALKKRFFIKHPPQSWELNASMQPFVSFVAAQRVGLHVKELADYEWHDLATFIHRAAVRPGSGLTNPTAVVRVYQHQLFFWVQAKALSQKRPEAKPEVLVFYRDSKNTSHVREADPLMLLLMDHFQREGAVLEDLEPARQRLLPGNRVPLSEVLNQLRQMELIL